MIGADLTEAGARLLHLLADRPDLVDADPFTVARVALRTPKRRTIGRSGGPRYADRLPDVRAALAAARRIRAEVRALVFDTEATP